MSDLELLFDNKKDLIDVNNFLTTEEISSLLTAITSQPEWQEIVVPPMHEHLFKEKKPMHLFASQYMLLEQHGLDEAGYLSLCQDFFKIWQKVITAAGFDPFAKFVEYLQNKYDVKIKLASKNNQNYFPLVARDLAEEVLPHADYGPYDGKGWAIDQVEKQIAWNIYLTAPGKGGETIVYDRLWRSEDVIDTNSYGIQNFNAPIKTKFSVAPGKLVMFNCRNFHAVLKSSMPRIAIGGLIGKTKQGDYIAWG